MTLESILYGIVAASMIATVICWFSCFNKIMTSDKFIYLFGRIIPSLSLILSMTFRFVPKFKEQIQEVSNAQKSMGRDTSEGSVFIRVKNSIRILSAVITWSLENAIDTSDSMKSRGYGLTGRTAYSNYVFDKRDVTALIYLCGYDYIFFNRCFAWKNSLQIFSVYAWYGYVVLQHKHFYIVYYDLHNADSY